MIFLHTLLLVVALASSMQEMLREYRLQLKADALYERHAYREAETVFRQLVSLAPAPQERSASRLNPIVQRIWMSVLLTYADA